MKNNYRWTKGHDKSKNKKKDKFSGYATIVKINLLEFLRITENEQNVTNKVERSDLRENIDLRRD